MRNYLTVVCLVVLFVLPSKAGPPQQATAQQPTHQHTAAVSNNHIDGSVFPELIKDVDAYRLVFLAATANSDTVDPLTRQRAMFGFLRLSDPELQKVSAILADFRAAHDQFVQDFNNKRQGSKEHNTAETLKPFIKGRNGIVAQTRTEIELVLGEQRSIRLNYFIQGEKRQMLVGVEDSGTE